LERKWNISEESLLLQSPTCHFVGSTNQTIPEKCSGENIAIGIKSFASTIFRTTELESLFHIRIVAV
jgi:hypothetical protein